MKPNCYLTASCKNTSANTSHRRTAHDQLRFPKKLPPIRFFRQSRHLRRKNLTDRHRCQRPQLSPGHGICRQMDVFRRQFPDNALSGHIGLSDEHRRISGNCGPGPSEKNAFHSETGQQRGPQRKEYHPGQGKAVPGESLYISRLCGILL